MDGITDDLFRIFKRHLTMIINAKFYGILIVGYFLNGLLMSLSSCRIRYIAKLFPDFCLKVRRISLQSKKQQQIISCDKVSKSGK